MLPPYCSALRATSRYVPSLSGIALNTAAMFSAVNSPTPGDLFGMVVSGTAGVRISLLAGTLRAALSSCRALWALGVQSWSSTCSGGLSSWGSKKGGSIKPPLVGRFCPAVVRSRRGLYGMHWLATDWSVLSCSHWSSVALGGFGRRVYWRWKVGKCGVVRACWHCLLLCPWDGFVMPNLFLLTGRGTGANAIDWRGRCCLCRRPCKYVLLFVSDPVVHRTVLGSGFFALRICWPVRFAKTRCQAGFEARMI